MLRILDVFYFAVFLLSVIYLSLGKSVGCFGQLRSLRSLKALRAFGFPHQPIFFIIASLCFSLFFRVLRFFLVGSAHTRTLFVKSVAKTFVFYRFLLFLLLYYSFLTVIRQPTAAKINCFLTSSLFRYHALRFSLPYPHAYRKAFCLGKVPRRPSPLSP